MTDIPLQSLFKLIIFLGVPFIGGYLAIKLKTSPIIGYIIGGLFLGSLLSENLLKGLLANFSMLGLVLLIFTIGLETNFDRLKKFGKFVLWGGMLQLVVSGFFIFFLSFLFKFSFFESFFFAMALVFLRQPWWQKLFKIEEKRILFWVGWRLVSCCFKIWL